MSWDDQEDTTIYTVVINHEEQYSIWQTDRGLHRRSLDRHAPVEPAQEDGRDGAGATGQRRRLSAV